MRPTGSCACGRTDVVLVARGICDRCYRRVRAAEGYVKPERPSRPAPCHPERKVVRGGLCHTCYYAKHPEKKKRRTFTAEQKQHRVESNRAWRERWRGRDDAPPSITYKTPAGHSLRSHLRRHYGITLERYEEMRAAQGGLCAVCRTPPDGPDGHPAKWRLHVDHDHKTGAVRGLLCFHCNAALGHAGDDRERLLALARYLDRPDVHEDGGAK